MSIWACLNLISCWSINNSVNLIFISSVNIFFKTHNRTYFTNFSDWLLLGYQWLLTWDSGVTARHKNNLKKKTKKKQGSTKMVNLEEWLNIATNFLKKSRFCRGRHFDKLFSGPNAGEMLRVYLIYLLK